MLYLSSNTGEESVITVGRYEEAKPMFNCMLKLDKGWRSLVEFGRVEEILQASSESWHPA